MSVKVGLKYIEAWKESMEEAICDYEAEPQYKEQIVFYGPSNFTRWSQKFGMIPMREVLLGKSGEPCVVNRGFGSSCPEHQLYYYPRMVRPLAPKVLVYSPGYGNGAAFGYSLEESWELAQRVLAYTMADFPGIHIYLCGAQPRRDVTEERIKLQQKWDSLLKEFAENTPGCFFVDVLGYPGLDRKDIFVEDGVHFNQEGFHIYGELFKEALKEELEQF